MCLILAQLREDSNEFALFLVENGLSKLVFKNHYLKSEEKIHILGQNQICETKISNFELTLRKISRNSESHQINENTKEHKSQQK